MTGPSPGWPEIVQKKLAALREAFGTAEIEDLAGGCYSIVVPLEPGPYTPDGGRLLIGDKEGPLGENGFHGHRVDLHSAADVFDYLGTVYSTADDDVDALIEGIRDFLLRGRRRLLPHDEWCKRRDQHHSETDHLVTPFSADAAGCATCRELSEQFHQHK
ncbi:hypothetical protein [Spirillospora sp. CA-128828]|uniref:hypothetical protein n=1 Tax=Spirillospora sp. CA-128828 TaxID=3240033 RepID=UPI003D8F136F